MSVWKYHCVLCDTDIVEMFKGQGSAGGMKAGVCLPCSKRAVTGMLNGPCDVCKEKGRLIIGRHTVGSKNFCEDHFAEWQRRNPPKPHITYTPLKKGQLTALASPSVQELMANHSKVNEAEAVMEAELEADDKDDEETPVTASEKCGCGKPSTHMGQCRYRCEQRKKLGPKPPKLNRTESVVRDFSDSTWDNLLEVLEKKKEKIDEAIVAVQRARESYEAVRTLGD